VCYGGIGIGSSVTSSQDGRDTGFPSYFAVFFTLALGMGWLSLKLPGNPAITWCILGGVGGLLSHIYTINGLGAVSKPPIMQGTDPFDVLTFAVFEMAFYWCMILHFSGLIWRWKKPVNGR
jgi:hypothetical protein